MSGAKGGSHAPRSLIASLNPPGLDAIPGQKALTSDHKTVLWCASSASRLRSGTLRLYKAGLQKRLASLLHPFLMRWLSFGCGLLPTRRTTGGAEAAHGQGLWQRQGSRRGACKSVTLAGFTRHPRQAEGEAILILSSMMRSLWIASAACSESNESCLSLKVVAHFIDLHSQPHFNYWPIEVVSARCSSSSTASGRTTSGLPTHPWPLRPPTGGSSIATVGGSHLNLKRCHKPPNR